MGNIGWVNRANGYAAKIIILLRSAAIALSPVVTAHAQPSTCSTTSRSDRDFQDVLARINQIGGVLSLPRRKMTAMVQINHDRPTAFEEGWSNHVPRRVRRVYKFPKNEEKRKSIKVPLNQHGTFPIFS